MKYNYTDKTGFRMAAAMGANATEADIKNVARKMNSMRKGPLAKIWDKIVALWNAFKSPDTPVSTKALIIGGFLYMISPIDVIPDTIPILGLTDDAAVITMIFRQVFKLAGSMAIGTATAIIIDKATVRKHCHEALDNLHKHNKLNEKNSDCFKSNVGKNFFHADVTSVDENNVTVDIKNSDNETVASDVNIKGNKVSDDIKVGSTIII